MQITLSTVDPALDSSVRAYAEYRVFTRLVRHEARVGAVHVALTRTPQAEGAIVCEVTADLHGAGLLRTEARRSHPSAAIDLAADRIGKLTDLHLQHVTPS